jgi:hypothetical protein
MLGQFLRILNHHRGDNNLFNKISVLAECFAGVTLGRRPVQEALGGLAPVPTG